MRAFLILLSVSVLVVGCASPSPQPKPSPCRYIHSALSLSHGASRKESI